MQGVACCAGAESAGQRRHLGRPVRPPTNAGDCRTAIYAEFMQSRGKATRVLRTSLSNIFLSPASASCAAELVAVLQKIELLAEISVARGCGFAALAILTFMLGLSWDMEMASRVGGMLVFFVCVCLLLKARLAQERPVHKTELWMMLERGDRPNRAIAQRVVGPVLQTCYLRFALHSAAVSAGLLAVSVTLQLVKESM
jgi:hypothetical protein